MPARLVAIYLRRLENEPDHDWQAVAAALGVVAANDSHQTRSTVPMAKGSMP
ncbi:MAG: hypothetical protein ABR509_00045 [Candidatus Limnocylindria bacterium]